MGSPRSGRSTPSSSCDVHFPIISLLGRSVEREGAWGNGQIFTVSLGLDLHVRGTREDEVEEGEFEMRGATLKSHGGAAAFMGDN